CRRPAPQAEVVLEAGGLHRLSPRPHRGSIQGHQHRIPVEVGPGVPFSETDEGLDGVRNPYAHAGTPTGSGSGTGPGTDSGFGSSAGSTNGSISPTSSISPMFTLQGSH